MEEAVGFATCNIYKDLTGYTLMYNEKPMKKLYIKTFKDVGMAVPKIRERGTPYMQQDYCYGLYTSNKPLHLLVSERW